MSVRNIRNHQSRGLLPPPEVAGADRLLRPRARRPPAAGPGDAGGGLQPRRDPAAGGRLGGRRRPAARLQARGHHAVRDRVAGDPHRWTSWPSASGPSTPQAAGARRRSSSSSCRSATDATRRRARRCCAPPRRSLSRGIPLPAALVDDRPGQAQLRGGLARVREALHGGAVDAVRDARASPRSGGPR